MAGCFCTGLCRQLGYCPNHLPPTSWWVEEIYKPKRKYGWECPCCGRVNSPSRLECPCYREQAKDETIS